jgi:hypothetical protein
MSSIGREAGQTTFSCTYDKGVDVYLNGFCPSKDDYVASNGTSASLTAKFQKIENVAKLAGKTVTLSFWAKANSNKNIAIEF